MHQKIKFQIFFHRFKKRLTSDMVTLNNILWKLSSICLFVHHTKAFLLLIQWPIPKLFKWFFQSLVLNLNLKHDVVHTYIHIQFYSISISLQNIFLHSFTTFIFIMHILDFHVQFWSVKSMRVIKVCIYTANWTLIFCWNFLESDMWLNLLWLAISKNRILFKTWLLQIRCLR